MCVTDDFAKIEVCFYCFCLYIMLLLKMPLLRFFMEFFRRHVDEKLGGVIG